MNWVRLRFRYENEETAMRLSNTSDHLNAVSDGVVSAAVVSGVCSDLRG